MEGTNTKESQQRESKKRAPSADLNDADTLTPKRLKSMEPDLTVAVGGVEFFHYKFVLCNSCEFFDNMLSANMRESSTSRIEFPDKDPTEWLEVYKFLDPPVECLGVEKSLSAMITANSAERLLPWFDYLGLDKLAKDCDEVFAKHLRRLYRTQKGMYSLPDYYLRWAEMKHLPCPKTKEACIEQVKKCITAAVNMLPRQCKTLLSHLKQYLLDNDCGDDLWAHMLRTVDFPKGMLEELSREKIVNSSTFPYLVQAYYIGE